MDCIVFLFNFINRRRYAWINLIFNLTTVRFSDIHEFEKPNDANALKLMNRCAEEVIKEFQDLILGYGQSDEYRFVAGGV